MRGRASPPPRAVGPDQATASPFGFQAMHAWNHDPERVCEDDRRSLGGQRKAEAADAEEGDGAGSRGGGGCSIGVHVGGAEMPKMLWLCAAISDHCATKVSPSKVRISIWTPIRALTQLCETALDCSTERTAQAPHPS